MSETITDQDREYADYVCSDLGIAPDAENIRSLSEWFRKVRQEAIAASSSPADEMRAAISEECAKIADAYAAACKRGSPVSSTSEDLWGDVHGRDIAKAIRAAALAKGAPG